MRQAWAVYRRELATYFASPLAYLVGGAFLFLMGVLFWLIVSDSREASLRSTFLNMALVLLLTSPALTMRLLAEEQRTGSLELLLTLPLRDWHVVLGKYLASLTLYLAILGLTLFYPFLLFRFGNPDPGPILTGYMGTILLGASFLSMGLFTSSLTENQVVAAITGFGLLLLLWLADVIGRFPGPPLEEALAYASLSDHYFATLRGVLDTSDVVYFLSVVVVFLFLTVRSLEVRRWR